MGILTAVYDACVLYPAPLRDLLMHLAGTSCFRARWTDEIHDEWINNLLANRSDLKRENLERTRQLMNAAVPDCLVTGYEDLISGLTLPDQGDRHVLAAAIRVSADVIVTFNEKHFPAEYLAQFEVEARHPDDFVVSMLENWEAHVCMAAKLHRSSLKNPPKSAEEYITTIEMQGLPSTADRLRNFSEII